VDEVLKALDTDNSGTISVNEFKVLIKEVLKALNDA
jgi:Ca2+-binding EF-hand superfamily protein